MSLILRRPKFDGLEGEPGDWIEEEKGNSKILCTALL
jgi:hypothetical protein